MIILSDTDVVRKLACCELLLDFLQYLECPPNEVWVLPALKPMLRRWLASCPDAARNAEQFLTRVKRIPPARVETLERFSALDVGEQQLLAVLCEEPRVKHLVTGDKRALDKIAALTFGDVALQERLQDASVYCFEAVLLGLIQKRGFSVIQARVRNKWARLQGQPLDGVVLQAFPAAGTAEHAMGVLNERLAELRATLPPIWFK
jgi:hypothetical protein